jgi:hypothetical protein
VGAAHEIALDRFRELARHLVDPAVHGELVALVDHAALLIGMEQGHHGRHEEGRADVVAAQEPQDARDRRP